MNTITKLSDLITLMDKVAEFNLGHQNYIQPETSIRFIPKDVLKMFKTQYECLSGTSTALDISVDWVNVHYKGTTFTINSFQETIKK